MTHGPARKKQVEVDMVVERTQQFSFGGRLTALPMAALWTLGS